MLKPEHQVLGALIMPWLNRIIDIRQTGSTCVTLMSNHCTTPREEHIFCWWLKVIAHLIFQVILLARKEDQTIKFWFFFFTASKIPILQFSRFSLTLISGPRSVNFRCPACLPFWTPVLQIIAYCLKTNLAILVVYGLWNDTPDQSKLTETFASNNSRCLSDCFLEGIFYKETR